MAYIFDPIQNTFIDDEDTSLGNKLQLNEVLLADATTEMDQAPDSFLRPRRYDIIEGKELPAETLEDLDVTFRKPNATGGRVNLQAGTNVMTLNPVFPERGTDIMSDEPKLLDVPGGIALPAG